MSDSDGGAQRQNSRAGLKGEKKQASADRKGGKGGYDENYIAIASAIDRVTNQLKTDEEEQKRSDDEGARREYLTILLLLATVIFTIIADLIFNQTMVEAKLAAIEAHADNARALDNADFAAQTALFDAHIDSDSALRAAKGESDAALAKAKEANDTAKDSERKQLRAYLGPIVPDFGAILFSKDGLKWYLINKVKNAGNTPALKIRLRIGCGFANVETNKVIHFNHTISAPQVDIIPGTETNFGACYWKAADLEGLRKEQIMPYIVSDADYSDVFGGRRKISVCTFAKIQTDVSVAGSAQYVLDQCPWRPSCSDEGCKRKGN